MATKNPLPKKRAEAAGEAPPAAHGADENQTGRRLPDEGNRAGPASAPDEIDLEGLMELGTTFRRAQELPETFSATVTDAELRPDQTGRMCLYMRLKLRDGSVTVVKYTPMHMPELATALKALGFSKLSEVIGNTLFFKVKHFRIGYPRPIPTEKVSAK